MGHVNGRLVHITTGCLLLVASVGVTACGEEAYTRAPDVEASVGDMELRDIQLAPPPEGVYEGGSAARLEFAMVNTGREEDQLVGVSGPDFAGVVVDGAPGSSSLPIPIPPGETVFSGGPTGPVLILTGIDETLRTAESMPVTFTFENAGAVTVDAVVSAPLRLTVDRYLREQRQLLN
ncbi:copper chaperone PCu(A)C [Geodermatophilus sp. DF01-2]|uniref:copper chaperone PCu(A)C n=1 Tax=Geodermatophilus sp. DF01-2 TaxID=2559610 RepID=UPI00107389BD|nr:copper chaperone PCu(A)C [Geodermatophilus sp. DF01_2]TFV63963.1 copper chaperone PCu(A)C [Geodermatophilus sp. DF01_2]